MRLIPKEDMWFKIIRKLDTKDIWLENKVGYVRYGSAPQEVHKSIRKFGNIFRKKTPAPLFAFTLNSGANHLSSFSSHWGPLADDSKTCRKTNIQKFERIMNHVNPPRMRNISKHFLEFI